MNTTIKKIIISVGSFFIIGYIFMGIGYTFSDFFINNQYYILIFTMIEGMFKGGAIVWIATRRKK